MPSVVFDFGQWRERLMAAFSHHAGVVDQHVDGAEVGLYLGDQRSHGRCVAQVGHVASCDMALAGQVTNALVDPRARGAQRHPATQFGQQRGGGKANAGGTCGTRDQRNLA